MKQTYSKIWLSAAVVCLFLLSSAVAQTTSEASHVNTVRSRAPQSVSTSLSTLPEADTLVYFSLQRILNEAAPSLMSAADLVKMRAAFDDMKKAVGVDPGKIDYLVFAVRFHKPTADLNFVAPDVMVVASGDFSADSLLTTARLYLQDSLRDEKYGSRTISLMKIDPIAAEAAKNPMLKSFAEIGAVPLNANTIAVGNASYLKAAIDAADGTGRISAAAINSLMRDPNVLVSAAGSPLTSFAKSFGLLGTETTPRDPRCDSRFGDFYAAVTMEGENFSLRGAMNADNPDTARIMNNLMTGLLQPAISSLGDKTTQTLLNGLRMTPRENEVTFEADIPKQMVAGFIRQEMAPTPPASPQTVPKKPLRKRRPVRK